MTSRVAGEVDDARREEQGEPFRILVPLDGSELAAAALPYAENVCRKMAGELALVRVLPRTVMPYDIGMGQVPGDVYQQLADDQEALGRGYLERVAAEVSQRGLPVHTYLERGDAAVALLETASRLHFSLIVMTTHGRTGLARAALGSVADRVMRDGETPVLLIRSFAPAEQREPPELRHALVPLDGSLLGETALFTIALRLAGPVLSAITLTRIVDQRDGSGVAQIAENYLDQTMRRFRKRLGQRECKVDFVVREGPTVASLHLCAHDKACDLILMSTHGESGLERMAFGSVAATMLHESDLPLLVIHPRDFDSGWRH